MQTNNRVGRHSLLEGVGPRVAAVQSGTVIQFAFAAVLIAVAASTTGVMTTRSATHTELLLPIAAVALAALVAVAVARFEWFVLCVIAIRTATDITRVRPSSVALAGAGGNTPSAYSSGSAASVLAVVFIVFSAIWIMVEISRRQAIRPSALDYALMFLVFACLASVVGSINRLASLTECARIIAAVTMVVVLERLLTNRRRVKRVLVAMLVAVVPPLLLGLIQAGTGSGRFVTAGVSRVVGSFLHPNTFGLFLDMFMLMTISLYRSCAPRLKIVLVGMFIASVAMLIMTYSRGAWIAFAVGVAVIGLLHSRKALYWIVGGMLSCLAIPSVFSRVISLAAPSTSVTGGASNSLIWRLDYWTQVLQLNRNNPITGIGLKGTKYLTSVSKAPHNDYLRAYAETGVLGLLAFMVVIVSLVLVARKALRSSRDEFSRGIAVGFSAVLAAYIVDSFGDNIMSEVVILWYFYAAATCAIAVSRLPVETDYGTLAFVPARRGELHDA